VGANSDVIREEIEFHEPATCPRSGKAPAGKPAIKINGKSIHDFVTMTVEEALNFLAQLKLSGRNAPLPGRW
jgi:excinuclease UvrABC ATPase subunit